MYRRLFIAALIMGSAFGQSANTALSNLSGTAVNTDVLPGTDKGPTLGSASYEFKRLNIGNNGAFDNSTWAPGVDTRINGVDPTVLRPKLTGVSGAERDVALSGVIKVPTTSTDYEVDAVSGMIVNQCSGMACAGGAVAGSFFAGVATNGFAANRNVVWGLNLLTEDTDDVVNHSGGFDYVTMSNEFDYNVFNSKTDVTGLSFGGASTTQPHSSIGIILQAFNNGFDGPGNPRRWWDIGYATQIGCCQIGLVVNPLQYAATADSQAIQLASYDSGFNALLSEIHLDSAGNLILPAGGSGAVFFQAASSNIADINSGGFSVLSGNVYIASQAGTGNAYACLTSAGAIVRSATPC